MALANGGNENELKARLSTRMAFGTAGKYAPYLCRCACYPLLLAFRGSPFIHSFLNSVKHVFLLNVLALTAQKS